MPRDTGRTKDLALHPLAPLGVLGAPEAGFSTGDTSCSDGQVHYPGQGAPSGRRRAALECRRKGGDSPSHPLS